MTEELSNRDYLVLRAYQAGLHEPRELAAFIGQMEVESGGFGRMHENLNYSGRRLLQVFPGRNGIDSIDEANAIARGEPETVANAIYGGEWGRENLGNTEAGDGWRYHGRGYVQLTGRDNYLRDGRELGLDLVGNPDIAADRENAAGIAIHYWQSRVVQRQHEHNIREATHDINGGYNHLPERRAAIARWEKVLTPHVMERLSRGEVALPSVSEANERRLANQNLQAKLNALGIADNDGRPLVSDGNIGPRTVQAIANFQHHYGLTPSGAADPLTLAAIDAGIRTIRSFEAVEHFGQEFLPPGYRTDWLDRDARDLPNYLHASPHLSGSNAAEHAAAQQNAARHSPAARTPSRQSESIDAQHPHHHTPTPPVEPASLPALPTTQTLEPGDRSAAVEAMQRHLLLLGATDRYGEKIRPDRDYGDRTRDAVEQFQLWAGREPTGIADPDTLKALQSQVQFAQRRQAQGIVIAPEAHLADRLKPAVPNAADAAIERPVQGRSQAGLPAFSDPSHSQHALYADVQRRFQAKGQDLSEEQLSALTKRMHLGGYRPGWEGDVIVYQDKAVVGAASLSIRQEFVDLNASVPSVQQTMQTFQAEQQSLAQGMERLHPPQAQAHGHGLAR